MGASGSIPSANRHWRQRVLVNDNIPEEDGIDDGPTSSGVLVPGRRKAKGAGDDQVPGATPGLGFGPANGTAREGSHRSQVYGSDEINDDAVGGRRITGSDALPNESIYDHKGVTDSIQDLYCDICAKGKEPSAGYCRNCSQTLCSQCIVHHKKIKATMGHTIHPKPVPLSLPSVVPDKKLKDDGPDEGEPDYELVLRSRISIRTPEDHGKTCQISAIAVLPNGKLVVTDCWANAVKLIDIPSERVLFSQVLAESPEDVTVVSNSLVAVTVPKRHEIQLCIVEDNVLSVGNKLKVDDACTSVAFYGGNLYVSFNQKPSIDVIPLNGDDPRSLSFEQAETSTTVAWYLAASSDAIYVSDWRANNVFKISHKGKILGKYEDDDLIGPVKLTVTKDDRLFICSRGTDSIHVVASDMRKISVMESAGVLVSPTAISYSVDSKMLFVGINPRSSQTEREMLHVFQMH